MKRSVGIIPAVLLLVLPAAFAAAADAPEVREAVRLAEGAVRPLLRGDIEPLIDLFYEGRVLEDVVARMLQGEAPAKGAADALAKQVDDRLRLSLRFAAGMFQGSRAVLLPPIVSTDRVGVPVRWVGQRRGGDYWVLRFALTKEKGGPHFEGIDLPLAGKTLTAVVFDPMPRPVVRAARPGAEERRSQALRWALLALLGGGVLIAFGYVLYLKRGASAVEPRSYWRHPTFYLPVAGAVILLGWTALQLRQEDRPPAPSPGEPLANDKMRLARLEATGKNPAVVEMARRLLGVAPDDFAVRLALTRALLAQAKSDQARPLLEQMLKRGEAHLFAHYNLAHVLSAAGDGPAAVKHMEAVVGELRDDDALLAELAILQLHAGDPPGAKSTLDRAAAIDANSFEVLACRARLLVRENDLDAAAGLLRRLKQMDGPALSALLHEADFASLRGVGKNADLFAPPPAR